MSGDQRTSPEQRVASMGLEIGPAPAPVAAFAPYRRQGATVYVSGQIATRDGSLVARGKLGAEVGLADGQDAARACAVNVLAQLRAAGGGSLDNVAGISRITVYVASSPDFTDQPQVADGASVLLAEILGPHARAAVGVAVLPRDTAVEVDAVAELAPSYVAQLTERVG